MRPFYPFNFNVAEYEWIQAYTVFWKYTVFLNAVMYGGGS